MRFSIQSMSIYKLAAISYLNSTPFVYGIKQSSLDASLSLHIPSHCANLLQNKQVDLALVPIAIIPQLKEYHIVSPFCIGSDGPVQTVCLFSDVPLNEIDEILLDYHSKTSIALLKVLCKHYWKIEPNFLESEFDFERKTKYKTASLIIGDKAYEYHQKFEYVYDLSQHWKKFTGLPFVFACWVSTQKLDEKFIRDFSSSLQLGLNNLETSVAANELNFDTDIDKLDYLTNFISYDLDEGKRKAMKLFFELLS